jgi:hypothetical protein
VSFVSDSERSAYEQALRPSVCVWCAMAGAWSLVLVSSRRSGGTRGRCAAVGVVRRALVDVAEAGETAQSPPSGRRLRPFLFDIFRLKFKQKNLPLYKVENLGAY